ncbi:LysR family transcriptional regulator [Marmoricola endophyticus]|uniref:LysR family transcriptional regulator n=1 Tax=Marmoricola endophyticus TaxID=2040280 RepID=A0A917BJU0_9ACTN|nr:LysR family transcriptional regulator [Marmoricola endophyticus]GGF44360.1 LysR family transcriptional regulator [Marmoricola endophyticus]
MPMDPSRLLVLQAVHRTGGVLSASRVLHLTPSGVSQHLAKLEREAGLELVDRTRRGGGRPVTLTAAGRALAEQTAQLTAAMASVEREADRYRGQRGGVVRIGSFASALALLVAPAVVSLSLTEPAIDPRVVEVTGGGLDRLVGNQLDLLVTDRPPAEITARHRGAVVTELMHDPLRIVLPAEAAGSSDEEILRGPWILADDDSRRTLERVAIGRGVTLDARHVGYDAGTVLALVAAGLGAAISPQLTLSNHPRARFAVYSGALDPGGRTISVVHGPQPAPAVERFVEELRRQASDAEQPVAASAEPGDAVRPARSAPR